MLIVLNYVILEKMCTLNVQKWVQYFKNVCIEYIKLFTFFEKKKKIVYIKVQNCALYLKKLIKKCVS